MLGENLKKFRIKCRYNQLTVAEKLNLSRQTISRWENNRGLPDVYTLKRLAVLYNISLDSLTNWEKSDERLNIEAHNG
jgi:transcriptional regulator with XRE-family HTH domain